MEVAGAWRVHLQVSLCQLTEKSRKGRRADRKVGTLSHSIWL